MRLLLASRSATRRRMLQQAGVPFDTVDVEVDEAAAKREGIAAGATAATIATRLAEMKAKAAAVPADVLVLGSDQVLELADGRLLSKPGTPDELREQLQLLAGTTHRLHSAAALALGSEIVWSNVETVELGMRPLTEEFIASYLEQEWEEVRWNVGGYRIEGPGIQLFEAMRGSHFAILGMPLLPLLAELRRRGVLTS